MNILLWILQIALAWLCIAGGYYQIFKIGELQKMVVSMRMLPPGIWAFLGAFGLLCGLGLIIPMLTPIAAAAVAVESVFISALYIYYGDSSPLIYSLIMAIMAGFIAYGRFVLKPF